MTGFLFPVGDRFICPIFFLATLRAGLMNQAPTFPQTHNLQPETFYSSLVTRYCILYETRNYSGFWILSSSFFLSLRYTLIIFRIQDTAS